MTKIKFIAFILFTALITSCSSDENNSDNASTVGSFDFVYNNETKKISSWEAIKMDDFIEVSGQTTDGIGIDFKFNTYGNLFQGFTHGVSALSTVPMHEVSEIFTANTFTFTIIELNTANKTVKVKFSGKLYDDGYDFESNYITNPSNFITVSGAFDVSYSNLIPNIAGLGTFAKIDGKDWHAMSFGSTTSLSQTILNVENDGEYNLGIVFPRGDLKTGTFPFSSNNFANRISVEKFDLATHEFIDYNVAGTVTYTTVNDYYVEGTFSLVATHPVNGSKIVITEGKFKEGR
ncbi:hypothetical protein [Flavobacterium sp.]|uniref:hypothetical protein n=1 Tax=Flavobacterium sp. TaxID=239 RepID=UPI002B638FC0|nr:hypothetical protein [Flavobacterium sp.]HSD09030.1 hypothetical protein [Flavobacterium sp.]